MSKSVEKLAKKLMVWMTGVHHNEFYKIHTLTVQQAWDRLAEWEKDDYRFCAKQVLKDSGKTDSQP